MSKVLYSVLKGASSNHAWNLVGDAVDTLYSFLVRLHRRSKTPPPVLEELRNLAETPAQFLSFLDKDGSKYAQQVRDIAADIDATYNREGLEKMIKDFAPKARLFNPEREVNEVKSAIDEIKQFAALSAEDIVKKSVSEKMASFFMNNFRIGQLSDLVAEGSKGFILNINGCIKMESKQEQLSLSKWVSSSDIVDIPSVFFIDSVGFKINSQLIRDFSRLRSRHRMVPDIAAYHTDLLNTIESVNLVPGKLLTSISADIAEKIGGRLEYDSGSLSFQEEGGGAHDASVTSSGILQLGLLGLVAAKGLLREGSFLFIDEPETNLHPDWQVLMTGILCRLAVEGKVNIVLATHSPYILQYLRYGAEHDDEFDPILSVHHFTDKGINRDFNKKMDNHDRIEHIEDDLNEIYMNIFLKGTASA